jgi:hypothetical protein
MQDSKAVFWHATAVHINVSIRENVLASVRKGWGTMAEGRGLMNNEMIMNLAFCVYSCFAGVHLAQLAVTVIADLSQHADVSSF